MTKRKRSTRYGVGWVAGRCVRTGKRRYATRSDAVAELARIVRRAMTGERTPAASRYPDQRLESGAYACAHCAGWHLTARPFEGQVVRDA